MTFARRHSRAKKNTVSMPLISMFHHSQLPATPCCDTRPVTTSGVSAANVVATIEAPASHHGTWRPEMKYSLRLSPPRLVKAKPMPADRRKYAATIAQSMTERFMFSNPKEEGRQTDERKETERQRAFCTTDITASASWVRTRPILLLFRVGFTRLLSRIMNMSRRGSIQIDVPVNPV